MALGNSWKVSGRTDRGYCSNLSPGGFYFSAFVLECRKPGVSAHGNKGIQKITRVNFHVKAFSEDVGEYFCCRLAALNPTHGGTVPV